MDAIHCFSEKKSIASRSKLIVWLDFLFSLMLWGRQKDIGPEEPSRGVAADLEVCLFKLLQNSHPISSQLTTSTYIFRKLLWTDNNIFVLSTVKCKDRWMWILHGLFVVKESIWLWSAVRVWSEQRREGTMSGIFIWYQNFITIKLWM